MGDSEIDKPLLDAMEGVMSLLNPGEHGVADTDPKAKLIRDLAEIVQKLSTQPVIIGGIAVILNGLARQTTDVDLLVARKDAMTLVRALQASGKFRKRKLERWTHIDTGSGLDVCVEGELTHPGRKERFPSPEAVQKIPKSILPAVGLVDLLALKAKYGRLQDAGDFARLAKIHGMVESLRRDVLARISDAQVRDLAMRWWDEAKAEAEREKDIRPSWGEGEE